MEGSGCGSKPKLISIGIAPLGIISIGIVPMGVVSIGVVPMGVISIGAVAMGLINASVVGMGVLIAGVNVMGVWWVGLEGMGPYRLGGAVGRVHHHQAHQGGRSNLYAYPSKQVALEKAKELGCSGVHAMGSLWMPCQDHPGP
jgi:hypothetical protein